MCRLQYPPSICPNKSMWSTLAGCPCLLVVDHWLRLFERQQRKFILVSIRQWHGRKNELAAWCRLCSPPLCSQIDVRSFAHGMTIEILLTFRFSPRQQISNLIARCASSVKSRCFPLTRWYIVQCVRDSGFICYVYRWRWRSGVAYNLVDFGFVGAESYLQSMSLA